jgi:hypothetical protein
MEVKQINRVDDEPLRQAILDEIMQAITVRVVAGVVHLESLRGLATVATAGSIVTIEYRGKASGVAYQFWMDKEHGSVRALGAQLRRLRDAQRAA